MTHSLYTVRIDEHDGPGRLGRHVEHDSRSLAYAVDATGVALESKTWARETAILDQGDLGSCTGNAAAGCLGTDPFFDTTKPTLILDENEARRLYSEATVLDSFPGDYPPDDTGSTGLAVAKACKNDGLISGYQHATSIDTALAALMSGPVITGVNWYEGFDQPDAAGRVKVSGSVRGGHEFVVRAVDVDRELVLADNSWGESWGLNGSFCFSIADWTRLLDEDGDVTVFVPLTQPAPAPTPTPAPTPAGDALAKLVKAKARFDTAFQRYQETLG